MIPIFGAKSRVCRDDAFQQEMRCNVDPDTFAKKDKTKIVETGTINFAMTLFVCLMSDDLMKFMYDCIYSS